MKKSPPTAELITEDKFMRWLREQPHDRTFVFSSNRWCLFASFLNETNPGEEFSCGSITFTHRGGEWTSHRFPLWAVNISHVLAALGGTPFSVRFIFALLQFKQTLP